MTRVSNGQGRLPRGRHKLTRAAVEANQRTRLLTAATEVLAEAGYIALTVDQVIEGAGVSRATFYEQFADKHQCVLAAHEAAFDHLNDAIQGACAGQGTWVDGVAAGIGAALEFAAERPDEARLVIETYPAASDPLLAGQGLTTHERLAELLRPGREQAGDPGLGRPETTERAVIGAAISVVGSRLLSGEAESLPSLRSELVQLILTPYLGVDDARRAAQPLEESRAS